MFYLHTELHDAVVQLDDEELEDEKLDEYLLISHANGK